MNTMLSRKNALQPEYRQLDLGDKIQDVHKFGVPDSTVDSWQDIVDLMATIIGAASALITRIDTSNIEILVTNSSTKNPVTAGFSRPLTEDLCSYCEAVVDQQTQLLITDARQEPGWETSPELSIGLFSYLGLPLNFPDGTPFGTICVLDTKENQYDESYQKLLGHFREVVENQLALLFMNHSLGEENQSLNQLLQEVQTLRGILPICASCKNIRDDEGYWHSVEAYVASHTHAQFSHGICSSCVKDLYPELAN